MRLIISTGEVSGDLQGSFLVSALFKESEKRSIPLEIFALGGIRMKEAGAELIANTSSIGAIGFWEVLPYLIPTLKTQRTVDKMFAKTPPDALILIDYMGPNIRLGNKVRKLMPLLPIVYYNNNLPRYLTYLGLFVQRNVVDLLDWFVDFCSSNV